AAAIGLQKCPVISEGNAAVGIAIGAEHKSMGEETGPAIEAAIANREETQRWHPMKKLLPRLKLINVWRRRPAHAFAHVTGLVEPAAEARMRFQFRSIGHVDGMRRDIIDRRPPVIAARWVGCEISRIAEIAGFRRRICERTPRRLRR